MIVQKELRCGTKITDFRSYAKIPGPEKEPCEKSRTRSSSSSVVSTGGGGGKSTKYLLTNLVNLYIYYYVFILSFSVISLLLLRGIVQEEEEGNTGSGPVKSRTREDPLFYVANENHR